MSTSVIGVDALIHTLNQMVVDRQEQVEKVLVESVQGGAEIARNLSPVDTGYFKSRWQVALKSSTKERSVVALSNDARYAAPLIFGHRTRSGSHVAPRDCLTPALLWTKNAFFNRISRVPLKVTGSKVKGSGA
jgi:hypothetical protein